ncbi:MAG: hypothetical protein IJU15_01260 [Synergistaceae bacterium]|nr:hypothetical protein [Synergistaceae bacterium]MBQ9403593.1 hypothetical protein [Synergistaceae bacterium]MBR0203335.1 hypothetical protein [Synergistaceae bacterium]
MQQTTTVRCPYCGTIKSGNTLRNSQSTCSNPDCRATLIIGNEGQLKGSRRGKM